MKLWHVLAPWGEDIYGYTTADTGAGTLTAAQYLHLQHFWPYTDVPWDALQTEIALAWNRAGSDAETVAAKVKEVIER